jgi:hypothetical protein
MPTEKAMYSTKLFADKVMPKLRGMFPEWESDDRFWCHPIAKRVPAGSTLPPPPTAAPLNAQRQPAPVPAE